MKNLRVLIPFLSFRASRAGLFCDLSQGDALPPPHSPRQARGCGISALRGDLEHFYKAKMLQLLKDGGLGGVANQVG
jgi:hypothetical protein